MSIQSVSFYQQDQNYWQKSQAQSQASSADAALINAMGQAETNLASGLASIANETALNRTNSEITALVQSVLHPSSSSSSSTSNTTSSATSGASASGSSTTPSPASGTGTVPVTTTTSLSTLGILDGGSFTVSAGTNMTFYKSTGTDTVSDLINAINNGPAFVTASINGSGKLTITARNDTEAITVGGSGTDAVALGFGTNNSTFVPKAPTSTSATAASSATTTSNASTASSSKAAPVSTASNIVVSSIAQESASSAVSLLSASGISGNLVDMLA